MLIEVRKLVFTDDLLQRALVKQCATQGTETPNSKIQGVLIYGADDSGDKFKLILQFMTADPKRPFEITMNEDDVLAALIGACKGFSVPLPRSAPKTLQQTKQGLAMVITMTMDAPTA